MLKVVLIVSSMIAGMTQIACLYLNFMVASDYTDLQCYVSLVEANSECFFISGALARFMW